MLMRRKPSPGQVYQKLKHYCAWQERCQSEVKAKALSLGVNRETAGHFADRLAEEGCLNEERFAIQFAGGRFRMKQWGKTKIRAELKKKRVSENCIAAAIGQINEKEYLKTVEKLARQKWNSIKGEGVNHFIKMSKTRNYLLQKGYEPALIKTELAKLSAK